MRKSIDSSSFGDLKDLTVENKPTEITDRSWNWNLDQIKSNMTLRIPTLREKQLEDIDRAFSDRPSVTFLLAWNSHTSKANEDSKGAFWAGSSLMNSSRGSFNTNVRTRMVAVGTVVHQTPTNEPGHLQTLMDKGWNQVRPPVADAQGLRVKFKGYPSLIPRKQNNTAWVKPSP